MPRMRSTAGDEAFSPYVTRTVEEWAALAHHMPLEITEEMVSAAAALTDPIDLDQVRRVYAPLTELIHLYIQHTGRLYATTHDFLHLDNQPRTPFVLGVAGSVSVGKSTTSRLLKQTLAQLPGNPKVDLVTTDGFLYPNAVLKERGLFERKGFPESYDRHALLRFVRAVKSGAHRVEAPVYSHSSYDIVPDEAVVVTRPDILIVEGLNVLQPPRRPSDASSVALAVSDYFDFSIYVDAEERDLREWYLQRFMLLRETAFQQPDSYFHRYASLSDEQARLQAGAIWDTINGPNLRQNIAPTRGRAAAILHKGPDHSIACVRVRKL